MIADIVIRHDGHVITDEVYEHIVYNLFSCCLTESGVWLNHLGHEPGHVSQIDCNEQDAFPTLHGIFREGEEP